MAQNSTWTRRINLYINGKEVKNDVKSIKGEMHKLVAAQSKMTIGSKEYNAQTKKIQTLNGILKKHRTNLYNTESSWQRLTRKMGGFKTIAIAALSGLALKAISTFTKKTKAFEDGLSSLSAITGSTGRDLAFLGDEALRLGNNSTKGAIKVLKAMELIGSAKPELLKNKEALAEVTEQTIILSEAARMELPQAASALTKAMNQFDLAADQAARTINVLAAGSKEGASAIPEITEAILKFGTVADVANVSLEESVAVIETLAEKGIVGAEAGTKLRNILIELQSGADEFNPKVVGLSTALQNLGDANLSTTELTKKFGKENVVAAQILVSNTDKVNYYTKAVTGTTVAYEQQITQTRNLSGVWSKFLNKLNGFMITIGNNTKFTSFLAGIVRSASKIVDVFTSWVKVPIGHAIIEEQKEVRKLTMALTDANTTTTKRKSLLEKLKKISPDIVKGLEAESLNYNLLKENIKAYNEQATNRIILDNLQAQEEEKLTDLADIRVKEADNWLRLQEKMIEANSNLAYGEGTREEKLKRITQYLQDQVRLQQQAGTAGKVKTFTGTAGNSMSVDTRSDELKWLQSISLQQSQLNNLTSKRIELENESGDYTKRTEVLKEILGINIITNKVIKERSTISDKNTKKEVKSLEDLLLLKGHAEKNYVNELLEIRAMLKDKTEQDVDEILEKYATLQEVVANPENEQKDILGMDSVDWDLLFVHFDQAMQYLDQVGQAWSSISTIQGNKDKKALQQFESDANAKKKILDKQLEDGIISEKEYTVQVAQLDAELDRKKADIANAAANRERNQAIFSIALSTAMAVMRIWADVPKVDFGISTGVLTALAIANGALQAAAVLSAPLPQYATGGYTDGDNIYRAGEAGTEWIATNQMVNNPYTGPVISALESIRTGAAPASFFGGVTPTFNEMTNVQTSKVGSVQAVSNKLDAELLKVLIEETRGVRNETRAVRDETQELNGYLSDPENRRAYIDHNTLSQQAKEDEQRNGLGRIK